MQDYFSVWLHNHTLGTETVIPSSKKSDVFVKFWFEQGIYKSTKGQSVTNKGVLSQVFMAVSTVMVIWLGWQGKHYHNDGFIF